MYSQRGNIALRGLDRCALTVGAISGPHSLTGALPWQNFTSRGFTWLAKSTLEKQTSQHEPLETVNMLSVAISLGNIINFSLCANISGFSQI